MQQAVKIARLTLILLVVYGLVYFILGSNVSRAVASFAADSFTGQLVLSGPVQLDLSISPPVVAPGQTAVLNLSLTNRSAGVVMPTVVVQLPSGVSMDARALPSATSLNVQTGSLVWQPVIEMNAQRNLTADVRVNVADVTHPQQQIEVTVHLDGQTETGGTMLWVGMPPQAQVSFSLSRVAVGQPVQLLAQTTGPGPFSQLWDLGDGRMVDADNPTVVFPLAGEYEIKLHIANPLTAVVVPARLTVGVEPAAIFEPERTRAEVNQPLVFYNLSGGQPPLAYHWDFGDENSSQDRQPAHVFEQPGSYLVQLVVENAYGRDEISTTVTIGTPPISDALIEPAGRTGEPLRGQAFGDDSVITFEWDMGDGRQLQGEMVSHVYRAAGDYWVVMTASNEFGQTEVGRWVSIEPGNNYLYIPLVIHEELFDPALVTLFDSDMVLAPLPLVEQERLEPLNLPASTAPAEQLYYYINAARSQNGLPPLAYAHELTIAAQSHVEDMALNRFTGHNGSDGSSPALRLLQHGYQGGYIGEATAWGLERAIQTVEFWLNSPSHRRILLNPGATEVGVGYTVSFSAPNVWYWAAEFANPALPPNVELPPPAPVPDPVIQLLAPLPETQFATGLAPLTFSWQWPNSLTGSDQFVVYLIEADGRLLPLGTVYNPISSQHYQLVVPGGNLPAGPYNWQVQLQNRSDGRSQFTSENWPLILHRPGQEPVTPTSVPVETPVSTPTATPGMTPTPTSQPVEPPPSPAPMPTVVPLPTAAP